MAKKDYYKVLGIPRCETAGGIRTAFRKLAMTYHPDRVGQESTRIFQEITEAYAVLSDPETRECYNHNLRIEENQPKVRINTKETGSPARASHGKVWTGSRESQYSSSGPIIENFFEDLIGVQAPGPPNPSELEVEVILTRDEAAQGGVLPMPIAVPCPFCQGSRRTGFFTCFLCLGQGRIAKGVIPVNLPPMLTSGTVLEVPLHNRYAGLDLLRLHIRIR